jgi:palmitoyl-protein thioesterase
MGDSCCDPNSMGSVIQFIQSRLPGVYIHSIRIGSNESNDRKASYFGNINEQVSLIHIYIYFYD